MLDKELMIKILQEKIDEGYDIVRSRKLDDKDFGTIVVNMFEIEKTIKDLQEKDAFDKEMAEKEKKEINYALSKNKEVEVER